MSSEIKKNQKNQNKMLKNIQESVLKFFQKIEVAQKLAHQPLWLAFSGGVDSSVLLHLIFNLGLRPGLIHVNHQVSPHSEAWAQHAKEVAKHYGLPLEIKILPAFHADSGESFEAWARDQRHDIFKEILSAGGLIFLGHHLDDQAETFLLQLLRGAGPKGLSSMPAEKKLGNGFLLRPLLSASREDIENYASFYEIAYVNDESNENLRFKRNVLRHEVLPILKAHFAGCLESVSRAAMLCAHESELLSELIDEKLLDLVNPSEPDVFYFKKNTFQEASPAMQRQLLRAWLMQVLGCSLNQRHLVEIEKLLTAEHWPQACFEVALSGNGNSPKNGKDRIRIFREKMSLRCVKVI